MKLKAIDDPLPPLLNWQAPFKKISFALMLSVPLLSACGGGSSGSTSEVNITVQADDTLDIVITTDNESETETVTETGTESESQVETETESESQVETETESEIETETVVLTVPPPQNETDDDAVTHSFNISWTMPDSRENGETLYSYEIGGYEILHKKQGDSLFISEIISNGETQSIHIDNLTAGNYELKVACFDTENRMSDYHSVHASIN